MNNKPVPFLERTMWRISLQRRNANERIIPKNYWANRHLYRQGHFCHICHKTMTDKAAQTGWWVHMTVHLQLAPVDAEVADDLSQGWFPIGNACAKKIPLQYRKQN